MGRPKPTQKEEFEDRCKKRKEEKLKRIKVYGHRVNTVSHVNPLKASIPITFTQQDLEMIKTPHDDPLVMQLRIANACVGRVMINGGSGVRVLFWKVFVAMELREEDIRPSTVPLIAFDSSRIQPRGSVWLPIIAVARMLQVKFLVVDSPSPFNTIMGWVWFMPCREWCPRPLYQVMHCLFLDGTYTIDIRGSQQLAKRCYALAFETKVEEVEEPLINNK